MIRVGINGFGRIGKTLARVILERSDMMLAGINDISDPITQAHLFRYDSIYGKFEGPVSAGPGFLQLKDQKIPYTMEKDPSSIDWKKMSADIVVESTGFFTTMEDASLHLKGGAGKVIIAAPSKSDEVKTILVGINDGLIEPSDKVVSNASCTTNSAGPLISVLDKHCGIESAYITTVHSYTGDQKLHDSPHRDLRRARAGAVSIIPTTTGAAKAITRIFPHLSGRIGGCGIRVPVPNGSLTDISCTIRKPMKADDINSIFRSYAEKEMKNILEYTEDPIVSRDVIGNSHSCVFDAQLTSVIGNMVKVVGWYDNETGYSHRLADLAAIMS